MKEFLKNLWNMRPRSYIKALEKAEEEKTNEMRIFLHKYYPILTYESGIRCWFFACPDCNDYRIIPMDVIENSALYSSTNNIDVGCLICNTKIPLTVNDFNHYMKLRKERNKIHDAYVTQVWKFLTSELDIIVGRLQI